MPTSYLHAGRFAVEAFVAKVMRVDWHWPVQFSFNVCIALYDKIYSVHRQSHLYQLAVCSQVQDN